MSLTVVEVLKIILEKVFRFLEVDRIYAMNFRPLSSHLYVHF